MRIFLSIISLCVLSSCDYFKVKDESKISAKENYVVSYKSYNLSEEELRKNIPNSLSESDQIHFRNVFIKEWIKKRVLYEYAKQNFTGDRKEYNAKVEKYKMELLNHYFLQEYVDYNLDTVISESELREYYKEKEKNFPLRENILRYLYVKIPKSKDSKKVRKIVGNPEQDLEKFKKFCLENAVDFYLDHQNWIPAINLSNEYNLSMKQIEANDFIVDEGAEHVAFFKIIERKSKGEKTPFEFVKNELIGILINRNKQDVIAEFEEELYNKSLESEELKIVKE